MKLKMRTGNYILGLVGILGGVIIVILAFVQGLDFTSRGLPGPGFFPVLCGCAIALCSALILLENYGNTRKATHSEEAAKDAEKNLIHMGELRNFVLLIGCSWGVVLLTKVGGLLLSIMAAVILLVKLMAGEGWVKSLLVGVGTAVVLYLVFGMFLGVPLPKGMLGLV